MSCALLKLEMGSRPKNGQSWATSDERHRRNEKQPTSLVNRRLESRERFYISGGLLRARVRASKKKA